MNNWTWRALVLMMALALVTLAARALVTGPRLPTLARVEPHWAEALDGDMVWIAAGDFWMGSDAGRDDERPQRLVYLDAFEMDRYEVTNAQYVRYLQATGRSAPRYWADNTYLPGQADDPVVGVSWDDADAYCAWAGKRLPTEAEWEKACRGTQGLIYPWGDLWRSHLANVSVSARSSAPSEPASQATAWDKTWQLLTAEAVPGQPRLMPVGSYPDGASVYGVMDMMGNASEWVADWYNWGDYSNLPTRNPRVLGPPWNHCVRGTAWYDPVGTAEWVTLMSRCSARSSSHEVAEPRVGLRCARSAQ